VGVGLDVGLGIEVGVGIEVELGEGGKVGAVVTFGTLRFVAQSGNCIDADEMS
jgi:hypothetical protein